ncbi:hypothetical protein HXX76_016224 [Chlamydomonas incerta]|uniref:HNH nuclease domain-containing protein n=1 Tax=Chlamydomonas incerta TaxID=51695 RepID=A0A835VNS5_CHLIN|nr:hypothetical protein HXX76_016224 [Chlamydomonas incerta]|eukprot:KAG2422185.1 hypothetical protein HXX76_016224 [Chlamydomonas incerta]
MAKRVRDIQSEIDEVTKEIKYVDEQVRKAEAAEAAVEKAWIAVRATLCEIAKKLKRLDLEESERVALIAEQQSCVAEMERLSMKEEQLRRDEEQLRRNEEQLRMKEEQLREEKLQANRTCGGRRVATAAATGSLPSLVEAMKAALTDMGVPALVQAASMMAQLQLSQFDYSASKASPSRQGESFKERLQAFYDNSTDDPTQHQHLLRCMLLDVQLPKTLVTACHLFKRCWKAEARVVVGLTDINDARNGLLLFKPLAHAFHDSRICFTSVEDDGEIQFKLALLDSELEETKVWDYAAEHNLCKNYGASQVGHYAATVTFGELHGKPLVFTNSNRPHQRCLRFQHLQAMRRAEASNWLPKGGGPTQDVLCNAEEAKRLGVWLTMAAQAPPPPDADDGSSATD